MDVERIEVLRGPQGTLYGRNSVGGTINVVTRQPTNEFETSARLTAGSDAMLRLEAVVRGPLVKDKLMGSFAVLRGVRDGFVHDLEHPDHRLGGDDTWAGRGQLRVVFGPRSELLLSGDFGRFDGVPLAEVKPLAATSLGATPGLTFDNPPAPRDVRASHEATGWNHQYGTSAHLRLPVGAMNLRSVTAWRRSDDDVFLDLDATELALATIDIPDVQHQFSQELTLSRRARRATWLTGVYAFDERVDGPVLINFLATSPSLQLRPHAVMSTSAWAVFSEATYEITGHVSVTGGLRYSNERKDIDNTGGQYVLGTPLLVPHTSYDYTDRVRYDAWTPKVSLQSTVLPDVLLYVSTTRGFKSGGFNASSNQAGLAFKPELAWSYEGGLKQTLASGHARLNAALFHTDYQNLQIQSIVRPGFLDITNAASAAITGIEIEADATSRALQVAGHVSWLDARYDRYLAAGPGSFTADAAGHRLNNAPEWSGGGSAVYEVATGGAGFASLRSDLAWQSRVLHGFQRSRPDTRPIRIRADPRRT